MTAPAPPGPNVINNHIAKRAPSRHDSAASDVHSGSKHLSVGVLLLDNDSGVEIGELSTPPWIKEPPASKVWMRGSVVEDAAGLIEEGGMIGGKRASHIFLQASTSKYAKRR